MFVELIESLRCPRAHEESSLVVYATRTTDRHVVEGVLGCPLCGEEFAITNGIAVFGTPSSIAEAEPPSAEAGMRIAAFLELTDARGFALLHGHWGAHADQVRRIADTPLVLVNPPVGAEHMDAAAVILVDTVLPFAPGVARAAAIGPAPAQLLDSIVRAVRPAGRLMGTLEVVAPAGTSELVRDGREWVAERESAAAAAPLVALRRGTHSE